MTSYANIGPFSASTLKGGASFDAIPTWTHQFPLTRGGVAGEDAYFGRVVSVDAASVATRCQFLTGLPSGKVPFGILIQDPTIGMADPAMNNKYFAGRPATVVAMGLVELMGWSMDSGMESPGHGSKIVAKQTTGVIGFVSGSVPSGYTQIPGAVWEVFTPNHVRIWVDFTQMAATPTNYPQTAAPTFRPGAGTVAAGTVVQITSTTPGAVIYYTTDGTVPDPSSPVYSGGYPISAPVTLSAVAIAPGYDPSPMATATYAVS